MGLILPPQIVRKTCGAFREAADMVLQDAEEIKKYQDFLKLPGVTGEMEEPLCINHFVCALRSRTNIVSTVMVADEDSKRLYKETMEKVNDAVSILPEYVVKELESQMETYNSI